MQILDSQIIEAEESLQITIAESKQFDQETDSHVSILNKTKQQVKELDSEAIVLGDEIKSLELQLKSLNDKQSRLNQEIAHRRKESEKISASVLSEKQLYERVLGLTIEPLDGAIAIRFTSLSAAEYYAELILDVNSPIYAIVSTRPHVSEHITAPALEVLNLSRDFASFLVSIRRILRDVYLSGN
ncbi:hypothetical protein CANCADRAFT_46179 [Tortispora caseinolytica NRRL Y-17796]|uniref:Kinetochore protein SPC25 n=1 Tax=Tortispora caseinolytica NRRL Y-17796 TaxID=767744 RepID=A0A1E4TDC8_9ASCO|nr:hypothetical protein CANCADRAFT_46179 [Tortispora caseinolytica NRRL Y-17796]